MAPDNLIRDTIYINFIREALLKFLVNSIIHSFTDVDKQAGSF